MTKHTIPVKKRCAYRNEKGDQCKVSTVKTHPYCHHHTKKVLGLYIAPSCIPQAGLGLYAIKPIKKGTKVVEYAGEVITTREYDKRYGKDGYGEYGMAVNSRKVIDARKTSSGLGRYVCDYYGSGKRPNAEYQETRGRIDIVAVRDIKPGEEIMADYGREIKEAMGIL